MERARYYALLTKKRTPGQKSLYIRLPVTSTASTCPTVTNYDQTLPLPFQACLCVLTDMNNDQHGRIVAFIWGIADDVLRDVQVIRDGFIADTTVTVVLIGACTWQRKHVDWEIGSSLRATKNNPRCGLLGILLPTHPDYVRENYRRSLIPPRLADNSGGSDAYAGIYDWTDDADSVKRWIDAACTRRDLQPDPDNSREQFKNNRSGLCSTGWQN